ncbi:hypothetical protein DPMN_072029 [Dreissena polymorpha]|uniref:Uncharacterized protein n=1 Tax=Dreissena polymorpha TaxID=45954 RepID=A0A9D3Z8R8_DREPO|nr:hypothetical protein DPMN_072029 [Dreissena polymorpha]
MRAGWLAGWLAGGLAGWLAGWRNKLGRNSGVSGSIWPIIELDLDVIALHMFMKFGEDLMTIARVIERKRD